MKNRVTTIDNHVAPQELTPSPSSTCSRLTPSTHGSIAYLIRLAPRNVSAKKLALIEQDAGKRLGAWKKLVHPVAGRPYFVNDDTGQTCWTTPAEVSDSLPDTFNF